MAYDVASVTLIATIEGHVTIYPGEAVLDFAISPVRYSRLQHGLSLISASYGTNGELAKIGGWYVSALICRDKPRSN